MADLAAEDMTQAGDGLGQHIFQQLEDFRRKLLDPTLRNPLLSFSHREPSNAFVRIVDELPDLVFEKLEGGGELVIRALGPPRTEPEEEETESFQEALRRFKAEDPVYGESLESLRRRRVSRAAEAELERRARDRVRFERGMEPWEAEAGLSLDELARRRGLNADFDLAEPDPNVVAERHHDDDLQTLLPSEKLEVNLRGLRERARSSVREMGVPTLFAAFGFLEWYEDENSERSHFAPLVLLPLEINRRREGQGYCYFVGALDQKAAANLTLALSLGERFGLVLPSFDDDDTPETYFHKVQVLSNQKPRWQVRRFLTLGVFPFAKIAVYEDLDLSKNWPSPDAMVGHESIRNLVASAGDSDSPFADEYPLDDPKIEQIAPRLIYDADSSQHSAMIDVLAGKDVAIHGPPGTGKSQTITNIIAAALAAGKSVLFVAEKLAALDVVADRMNKAGLGNFCLHLHRNVKKASVLADFKQRLEMSAPKFDATSYEQDQDQWRAQRDALKQYCELINQTVGELNISVHDVLWRATQVQALLHEVPIELHTLALSDVRLLQPRDIRAARDSLGSLQARFEAARQVTDIADHPWRGVRLQSLTPLDVAGATNRSAAWRQSLRDVSSLLGKVLRGANGSREFGALRDVVGRLQSLPEPPASDWFENHKQASESAFRQAVLAFTDSVQCATRIRDELSTAFAGAAAGKLNTEELNAIAEEGRRHGVGNLTLQAIIQQLSQAKARKLEWEKVLSGVVQLQTLFRVQDRSETSVLHVLNAAKLLVDADRSLLLSRTEALVEEANGHYLRNAAKRFEGLRTQFEDLASRYHLASIPEPMKLREHAATLRDGGFLSGFGREFKEAQRAFRAFSKSAVKATALQIAAEFDSLADYRESEAELQSNERLKFILGPGATESGMDLNLALSVNSWASEVVSAFPGMDPIRSQIRGIILTANVAVLDEIRTIFETISHHPRYSVVVNEGLSFDAIEARLSADAELANGLHTLIERIEAVSLNVNWPLDDLTRLSELVTEHSRISEQAENCDQARSWFGKVFAGATTDLPPFTVDLRYLERLEEVGLPNDVCQAVFEGASLLPDGFGALKRDLESAFDRLSQTWQDLCNFIKIDEPAFFAPAQMDALSLDELEQRASRCAGDGQALSTWHALQMARSAALETSGRVIVETLEGNRLPLTSLVGCFDFVLYRGLANAIYHDYPDLQRVSGRQLQDARRALAELDEKLLNLERKQIAHALYRRRVEPGVGMGRPSDYTERALIQHNVSLQRSPLPLRDLLRRASNAALQLKPCFMMSPVTVAQYLQKAPKTFDLVIIDEASQMRPEDAFGAIARAKQCIIVGDPMQLPPTSFFETAFWTQTDEDDADDRLYEQVESILDLALRAFRPTRYLRWHYRSLHSGLIQFSNHHFYDGRLIVFPAANEDDPELGVRFEAVDGIYEGRRNEAEATVVVNAAIEFMKSPRTRNFSLGVVAINQTQRDLLSEMFDQELAKDPRADGYRRKWDETLYPFFVKNLESVQGDERDAIFISMVYGPDRLSGRVANRFGPINKPGGHRRLNVLFTRARRQVRLFSSLKASDVLDTENRSQGVRILRAYLEYAATGRLHVGAAVGDGATESPFEDVVKSGLESHGFEAVPQVGVAGYRIDLGVRHPRHPHGFLLGIECDGATYHSARSVRDRDRLRQMILESLGWEIYRIWSTDWFADPDAEFAKLLSHLQSKISSLHSEAEPSSAIPIEQEAGRTLPGVIVEMAAAPLPIEGVQNGDIAHAQTLGPTDGVPLADEAPEVVEVGDLVEYACVDEGAAPRQVRIVRGPDNPAEGIINDADSLAIALLGCSVGEVTTVEQPTGKLDVVARRIFKQSDFEGSLGSIPSVGGRPTESGLANGLTSYSVWSGDRLPDPRGDDQPRVEQALYEIIDGEGPVLVARAYRLYSRASGLQRVGRQVQASLNKALSKLVRSNRVLVENESNQLGLVHGIARTLGAERVRLRERGPRTFEEIPPSELAAHMRLVREELLNVSDEELQRELLDRYGLVRMTQQVRNTLSQIYSDHAR